MSAWCPWRRGGMYAVPRDNYVFGFCFFMDGGIFKIDDINPWTLWSYEVPDFHEEGVVCSFYHMTIMFYDMFSWKWNTFRVEGTISWTLWSYEVPDFHEERVACISYHARIRFYVFFASWKWDTFQMDGAISWMRHLDLCTPTFGVPRRPKCSILVPFWTLQGD